MKVTREKTENCQAFLTVEMETAEVEESMKDAYSHLAKKANIPGFRKGKAPQAVLERYIGKESVLDEALTHLIPKACEDAVKEQGIEAFAQPHIEIAETDPAVIFKATVPLPPEIELGDYHGIKIEPELVEITEDKIDAVMEELRHQHST
ncbi:MAG: trigger factor family protein, partial [Dehalococcoidales bacterium]|nr:trigger factor family protein [Dehalococcoidales bacterium]